MALLQKASVKIYGELRIFFGANFMSGLTFVGMLFTGIMLTASGPKVLEYNVRFGDPETQAIIPLLRKETDLAEVMMACTEGRLEQVKIEISSGFCANVVIAAGGYPDAYAKGDVVEFGPAPDSESCRPYNPCASFYSC